MNKNYLLNLNLNNFEIDLKDDENTMALYEQLIDNNIDDIDEEA